MGNPVNSPRLMRSQMQPQIAGGAEIQDARLYSYITLPAAINPANGNLFFADIEGTVGRQRTNMTRSGEVPGQTNFEIFGIGIKFLAPLTVLYTSYRTAILDAWAQLKVNQSERWVSHLGGLVESASVIAPSFSAAAGDNPVMTQQSLSFVVPVDPTILIQGGVQFEFRIYFATNVAALGSTVMGVEFLGLLDRGDIQLDQTRTTQTPALVKQQYSSL